MGETTEKKTEKRGPWFWEVVVYVVGVALTALGGYVWVARANAEGEWSLRLSQLWDSIGLISLGLAIVAIGLTLTILRVQNREADRADCETKKRRAQHQDLLDKVKQIAESTNVTVTKTNKGVEQLLGKQIASAQTASQSEPESEPATTTGVEPDPLDDLSLEGVRDGDISNLPLATHALADDRLLAEVKTREGVFYPVGAVPIGVLADVFDGWEAAYPDSKAQWKVGALVGAYRSYSAKALAEGRQTLQGAPWFVTFRRSDDTLVTYYLSRTGRLRRGQTERTPVVKRLKGEGADARWVPLGEPPDFT